MAREIDFVGLNEIHNTTDSRLLAINTPTKLENTDGIGDFLLFVPVTGTSTTNAAWTLANFSALATGNEQGSFSCKPFYRVATGAEAASYQADMNYASNYRRAGAFLRYRNTDRSSPYRTPGISSVDGNDTGSQATSPLPAALTGTAADDLVVRVYCASETTASSTMAWNTSALVAAGWNVRVAVTNEAAGGDDACAICIADKVGATDRPTAGITVDSSWVIYSFALKLGLNLPRGGGFMPAFGMV